MKNFLYGTTALVAASLLAGAAAQAAEPIKLSVGGHMKQWFGAVHNNNQTTNSNGTTTKPNDTGLNTDTMVTFSGTATTNSGITVGAVIKMDAIQNGNGASGGAARNGVVDQEYATLASGIGTVRAGVVQSSNFDMHSSAPDVGIGASNIPYWLAVPTGMHTFHRVATGATAPGGQANWGGTSFRSLTSQTLPQAEYISPKLYGFSLGASFAPSGGGATVGPNNTLTQQHNSWDVTLAYDGDIGPVKLGADMGMAKSYAPKTPQATAASALGGNNANFSYEAYNGGLKVGFAGFTLSGSYLRMMEPNVGDMNALANNTAANLGPRLTGHSFDAGLSYGSGPWAVSGTYYEETHLGNMTPTDANGAANARKNEKLSAYLVSGKYALGPGINLVSTGFYAEYKGKTLDPVTNTAGYGLVSGVHLVF
ncbi:MAG: porin [Alphaproteobacteria bacterium]